MVTSMARVMESSGAKDVSDTPFISPFMEAAATLPPYQA
jgi:hypothetical protein